VWSGVSLVCALACSAAVADGSPTNYVAEFAGVLNADSGWNRVSEEEGGVVYIPFEGHYESKGGRIESPKFKLDKEYGRNGYYRLEFSAKSDIDGYWWVDLYDQHGNLLPDINSRLYASDDWKVYEIMVPTHPLAVEGQIAFISKQGALVKDVTMRRATLSEAVSWCNAFYNTLPQLENAVPNDAWARLPKAKSALASSGEFHVVLLGDSIMNDTYCGNFTALAQHAFPDKDIRFYLSVRGSTGCGFYHDKEHFEEYVAKYRPNLVLIGGISNFLGGDKHHTLAQAEEWMVETIRRCHEIGAEVVVCSPPPSYEFRTRPEAVPFDRTMVEEKPDRKYSWLYSGYQRRACDRTGIQYWDLTTGPCEAIARSGKPLHWFKRDPVHNDDRGKQLIAQAMAAYFAHAANAPDVGR
jgi:hypothetical protein